MNSRIRPTLYNSLKSWLCTCSLASLAPQKLLIFVLVSLQRTAEGTQKARSCSLRRLEQLLRLFRALQTSRVLNWYLDIRDFFTPSPNREPVLRLLRFWFAFRFVDYTDFSSFRFVSFWFRFAKYTVLASCVSVLMSRYWARGKFREHERGVRVARGAADSNSILLSALQTSQVGGTCSLRDNTKNCFVAVYSPQSSWRWQLTSHPYYRLTNSQVFS